MNEYISGRNSVREAILAKKSSVNKIYISQSSHGPAIREIIGLAKDHKIPLHFVPQEKLDSFGLRDNHGIIAEITPAKYMELDELLDTLKETKKALLVVLDSIEDPHNVGAIIRNAVAFGADAVIMGKWRAPGMTDTVMRTSAGASNHINIVRVTNIADTLLRLKERGYWTAGADITGNPLEKTDPPFPLALVIGSEGTGLGRLIKERCDFLLSIPQTDKISSINASCASAVVLYEIYKKKMKI